METKEKFDVTKYRLALIDHDRDKVIYQVRRLTDDPTELIAHLAAALRDWVVLITEHHPAALVAELAALTTKLPTPVPAWALRAYLGGDPLEIEDALAMASRLPVEVLIRWATGMMSRHTAAVFWWWPDRVEEWRRIDAEQDSVEAAFFEEQLRAAGLLDDPDDLR